MKIRYYGLYDTVAKNMVSIFQSQSDDVCIRSCVKMVQDPHSDIDLLKDCICQYMFTVDSETGDVIDASKKDLFTVATLIEKFGSKEVSEGSLVEIRKDFEVIKKSFEGYKELDKKCQTIVDLFAQKLTKLEKSINDIIGGNIKCLKYKKKLLKK